MSTVPAETIATIRTMRAKGHSIREICAAVGKVPSYVHRYCKDVKMPYGPRKKGPPPKVSRLLIRRLRNQGMTYRDIAARVGCGICSVHRALHA